MTTRTVFLFCAVCLATLSHAAEWHKVAAEPDRRIELDRASVRPAEAGRKTAWGRVVLTPDEAGRAGYLIAKTFSRYDCAAQTVLPVRREFLSAQLVVIRDEAVSDGKEAPVRPGSAEDKLLAEVCKAGTDEAKRPAKAAEAATRKDADTAADKAPRPSHAAKGRHGPGAKAAAHGEAHWSYQGAGGPAQWGHLKPEYAQCDEGRLQSPIDIRDGIRLDLPPVEFLYQPSPLRIVDNGHTIQVNYAPGSRIRVVDRDYELVQLHFHKPAEEWVGGRQFDMAAHLVHKDAGGRLAVVAVLFEVGADQPLIRTLWNYLPLQQNDEVAPPEVTIDAARLLPENRAYFTYMGSLTTPPCTEGVLWLVMRTPVQVSQAQLAVFARLYPMNARPLQAANGRLIKESR